MKKLYYSLLLVIPALFNLATAPNNEAGKAGATGAPGEITCLSGGCHTSSNALNQGPGSLSLTSNIPSTGYMPNVTYQMQLKVKETGRSLFGMGLVALTPTNMNGGTLVVTSPTKTKILNFTVSGVQRKNMVHALNGGVGQDSTVFTFDWKAPATLATGDVTFYFAGNATNNNGGSNGDNVYTSTYIAKPSTASGNNELFIANGVDVFPNPVQDVLNIRYTLVEQSDVTINVLSTDGKLIKQLATKNGLTGAQEESIDMNDLNVGVGVYLVEIKTEKGSILRRVFVSK